VRGGALPSGLTLGSSTGTIRGMPTAVGVFTPTVTATNAGGSNSKQLGLTVNAPLPGAGTFTYYVDSANGLDSNPGTMAKPWKTIAKVNSTNLTAGQSVGFARGGVWREMLNPGQSGTAQQPITFGAYGSGAQPIISGANTVTGWTQVGGSNLWYAALGSTAPVSAFSDGGFLTPETAQSSMVAGSWYYSQSGYLYVWEPDGSAPSGHTIEASQRAESVWLGGKSYITLNDLWLEKNASTYDGAVQINGDVWPGFSSTGIQIVNCTIAYAVGGIYVVDADSVVLRGNTIYGNTALSQAGITVNQGTKSGSSNISILVNTIHDTALGLNAAVGTTSNINGGLISGNTIYNLTNNGLTLNHVTGTVTI